MLDSLWKSSLLCFVFFFRSGGERSGVQPHRTSHSAAPQVRAGHCPCGGQHLRVLQRSLNLPVSFLLAVSFSCWQLPFSYLHSYLGLSATEELAFISVIIIPTDCKKREKWQSKGLKNLPLTHHTCARCSSSDVGMPSNFPKSFPMTRTEFQSGSAML